MLYTKNSSETARYGYTDYVAVGDPASPSRVFQTMVKLDTSNHPTSEEFHYAYDGSGRLLVSTFAQTPASGFTPTTGNSWYDSSHPAATRGRAYYVYDAGGRMTQLNYWWDTWNSGTSSYGTPEAIISNTCSYEVSTGTSNRNRGLKTVSDFYFQNSSDHSTFAPDHEDQYGYDNNTDYLTSASYDGGSTTTTWSYDAAGNRNDATVVDNLSRATTISSVSRTYDILGNTTAIGSTKSMSWDELNCMASFTSGSTTTDYAYRSDGMRVNKTSGTQTVTYGYDGQMPIEECFVDTSNHSNDSTSRYALGARGLDRMETGSSVSYPVYDSHGNVLTTLSKSGSGYSFASCRFFDAWGGIRTGATTGAPSARHCANLGHLNDDESGLVYMRARYYEPSTGRFIGQDPSKDGNNWFTYCANDPVNQADSSGKVVAGVIVALLQVLCFTVGLMIGELAGYLLGVLFWQSDDPTFRGSDGSTVLGRILRNAGISVTTGAALAVFGAATYRYGPGLIAVLGVAGALGFLFGAYVGFLEATLDFENYEETKES